VPVGVYSVDGEHGGIDYLAPHADVVFSLALEDGTEIRTAEATVRTVKNRKLLPHLSGRQAGAED